jgi:hypothetical protein
MPFATLDAILHAIREAEPPEDQGLVGGYALYLVLQPDAKRTVFADTLEQCLAGAREKDPTRERELLERLALSPARAAVRALIEEMRK